MARMRGYRSSFRAVGQGTKKKFDRRVLDGMSMDERQEYMDENVYPIRKYYTVFNGDLIDGIPEKENQYWTSVQSRNGRIRF